MNYIVGDIGNTYTKISVLNYKFDIKRSYNLKTNKLYQKKNVNKFFKIFLNKNLNNKVLFSSVVPNAYKVVKSHLKKKNFKHMKLKI